MMRNSWFVCPGTSLLRVTATDEDAVDNVISYSIDRNSTTFDFQIDANTGVITNNEEFMGVEVSYTTLLPH